MMMKLSFFAATELSSILMKLSSFAAIEISLTVMLSSQDAKLSSWVVAELTTVVVATVQLTAVAVAAT
jgi:hypothetical protein